MPGASSVLRGAVVAYATDLKGTLLDVDRALLDARGAVDPDVAGEMARGVRARLGADVGLATTGVAGPDPQDGQPPGTVHVAVRTPDGDDRAVAAAGRRPGGGPRPVAWRPSWRWGWKSWAIGVNLRARQPWNPGSGNT